MMALSWIRFWSHRVARLGQALHLASLVAGIAAACTAVCGATGLLFLGVRLLAPWEGVEGFDGSFVQGFQLLAHQLVPLAVLLAFVWRTLVLFGTAYDAQPLPRLLAECATLMLLAGLLT